MNKNKIKEWTANNVVTIFFLIMCVIAFAASKQPLSFLVSELFARLLRNSLMVLSLIIPVLAGVGLNFGIVLGAMAAQAGLVFVTYWKIQGLAALGTAALISTPLAIVFGFLLGKLFNKTKGQEMITGMIAGYFANGIYQFFFLVLVGTLIPVNNPDLILVTGIGVKDTIALEESVRGSLDNVWKVSLDKAIVFFYGASVLYVLYGIWKARRLKAEGKEKQARQLFLVKMFCFLIVTALFVLCNVNETLKFAAAFCDIPMIPFFIMIIICIFMQFIIKTKLGQDFRAIGNNMRVADSAGINVNRTRIIAIMISTVLAAWGQLIFLQNMGNFTTYSSHEQVGTFSVAAILVGGASVKKATIKQAIIGILLFHTLFIVSPMAGKNLFNDAVYGEYFRTFISYGVIAAALVLHVSSRSKQKKKLEEENILME